MRLDDYDGVVFDLDGTILDSECIYHAVWMDAAEALSLRSDAEFFRSLLGLSFPAAIEKAAVFFGPDFDPAEFDRVSREAVEERLKAGVPLKPGVGDLIETFATAGLPLAIATSSRRISIDRHLAPHGLVSAFRTIVTQEDVRSTKPHPEPYLTAVSRIGGVPERCLAIEDSANGVRSAVAAGLSVVAIPDIAHLPEDLIEDCFHVLESLADLQGLIRVD